MKWIFIIMSIFLYFPSIGQNTFSKIYDLDDEALRNYVHDFEVIENNIYTYSSLFCNLEDSLDASCVALTKYNMQGDIIEKIVLDTLNALFFCKEGLTYYNDRIVMSTYVKGEKFKKVTLIQFDLNFNQLSINKYLEPNSGSKLENTGVEYVKGHLYYFGTIRNSTNTPDSVNIIKTDLDGNELDRFYYSYGNSSLKINSFQATPDGNFAFILKMESPPGANNGFDGYQLMKIDTLGNVLDTFVFVDIGSQPNKLLCSREGGYYFSSLKHPIDGWDPFSNGMINKMDANMDSIEWSLVLPNDQLVDGRNFKIQDYIEASNGDIVACGRTYDNTDTELGTGVPDKNSTWNGFIVRLSPDGEFKWLKLYKNDNDLLPHDEYGRFRPSLLKDIKELPDGRFVAVGNVYVNSRQTMAIDEFETEAIHSWILVVDENGCLEGYGCDEIIRLGNPKLNNQFKIGTKWTYESKNHPTSFVEFQEYIIEDTILWGGEKALVIEPGLFNDKDYMLVNDNKVYFWDNWLDDYQLNYDFDNDSTYYINYYNQGSGNIDSTIVHIDSIVNKNINGVNHSIQYCRSKLGYGNIERPFQIINNVGSYNGGPRLPIGLVVDNLTHDIQQIRCFENDSIQYTFSEVTCDSSWFTTSTLDVIAETIKIYPNPTNGGIRIEGTDMEFDYQIYSTNGRLIQKGTTTNKFLFLEQNGIQFIRIMANNQWIWKRVVKVE